MKISNFHKIMVLLLMLMVSGVGCAQTEIDGIWYSLNSETKEAEVYSNGQQINYQFKEIVIPETVEYRGVQYTVAFIGGGLSHIVVS